MRKTYEAGGREPFVEKTIQLRIGSFSYIEPLNGCIALNF